MNPAPAYIASQEFLNRSITNLAKPSSAGNSAGNPETNSHNEKDLKSSYDLLTSNYHSVNPDLQSFRDNPHFRVIGVVGRGTLKAKVLNYFISTDNVFSKDASGIQMHIDTSKDRTIFLNVNLNHYQLTKTGREEDVEMITLYITLLKMCHTVIIVEPEMEARNSIRLLQLAEFMNFGYEKLGLNPLFTPNIILVGTEWTSTSSQFVLSLFKNSRFQAHINVLESSQQECTMLKNLDDLANRFALYPMFLAKPYTELNWYQALQSLWKLHKSNYFFLKYNSAE